MYHRLFFILLALLCLAGCSTAPITLEESLTTHRATRNDVTDWPTEMRYRVGFQYAYSALNLHDNPTLDLPPDSTIVGQVPFAIYSFAVGDTLGGALGFADWLNTGLSKNARYASYYNRGLAFMGHANTHYFTFDERGGVATADDIHSLFDEAFALYQSIYNASGSCYMTGFDEKNQYRNTYSKDVPGLTKEMAFRCPHPVISGEELRVSVSSWANPFNGVRAMGTVQTQCWVKPPRGESFVDVRGCGIRQAERNRDLITQSRNGWMELVVTPIEDTPSRYKVISRVDGFDVQLPAPEQTQDYMDFLAARNY